MMDKKYVVGLDSSTQSSKAIAWDGEGNAIAEGRASIPMSTPQKGHIEQNIADWWLSACEALKSLASQVSADEIAGLAISNQRETIAFVDDEGEATNPAIVWLDERALMIVRPTYEALGGHELHRLTGKPPDLTPVIYRLAWLRENAPDVLDKSDKILDVHGYLTGRLTGETVASWTSADPSGLFDIQGKEWSGRVLDHLGLSADQFARCERPGELVGTITPEAADATGLKLGTPVYTAGGDGQCAGLGANAIRSGRIYLNLGTAIVIGAWSPNPDIGLGWRTMTSPTGEGYFLEGVMRAGTFFIDWFVENFVNSSNDPAVFDALEAEARQIEIGCEGLTVCPYLSGCMNPHWDSGARASFLGLGPHHSRGHLYRAVLESVTFEVMRCVAAMEDAGIETTEIVGMGGGANSQLLAQMIVDATGLPLIKGQSLEASALGAGMTAAVGAGWYADFPSAAAAMSREGSRLEPDPQAKEHWRALSKIQAQAYQPTEHKFG